MSRFWLCVWLCATALPAPVAAQSRAELDRRIARLTGLFEHAEALRVRADSVVRARVAVDTIRAGALRVVAARSIANVVAQGVDSAWRSLEATFGPSARAVTPHAIIVQFWGQAEGTIPYNDADVVNLPAQASADLVTRFVIQHGAAIVRSTEDSQLTAWLPPQFAPGGPARDRLDIVYIDLVTSPRSKAHRCYLGDLVACRAALALRGREDPILEWFDAADRRAIVRRLGRFAGNVDRCQRGGPDETCDAAMRALPSRDIPTPLSVAARLSLLQTALDAGGPGAYDRLRDPRSVGRPMDERLALAAGLGSSDSLLSAWRAHVLAARPHTVEVSAPVAWAAVLWGAMLGVLALRSTRWR